MAYATPLERFMAKVNVLPNGCWEWTSTVKKDGYAGFWYQGKAQAAHRVAYELFVGPIPEDLTIDHACHNRDAACLGGRTCRHRRCVNPVHLEPKPIGENILLGHSFQGENARKTHCARGHEFSGDNLRLKSRGKYTERACRICRRDATRKRRAAKRWLDPA